VAKKKEDLQLLGQHSALMKCEASDASKAKDRAEAGLSKLFEEFTGLQAKHSSLQESHATLQAKHAELQKDHSILKEELGQLKEKHTETLEQLKESQVSTDRALKGKLVAKVRYKHFHGEHRKAMRKLKEAQAKAARLSPSTVLHLESLRRYLGGRDPPWVRDLQDLVERPCSEDGPQPREYQGYSLY
jgi:chromosome segregation ATPase